jgi:hypothetical protein
MFKWGKCALEETRFDLFLKRVRISGFFYVWKSGFDYTDIVKCDGEFFLKERIDRFCQRV